MDKCGRGHQPETRSIDDGSVCYACQAEFTIEAMYAYWLAGSEDGARKLLAEAALSDVRVDEHGTPARQLPE